MIKCECPYLKTLKQCDKILKQWPQKLKIRNQSDQMMNMVCFNTYKFTSEQLRFVMKVQHMN